MHAEVPDTSHIFLSIGLGFYAEATLEEAPALLADRIASLQAAVESEQQTVANIQAHIELIRGGLEGLRQLSAQPA